MSRYYREKDEMKADMPYLYICGCDETQKIIEKLPTTVHLVNDGKDDDNGDTYEVNVTDAHTQKCSNN